MLVTMLPYSGTDAGGDSGHVQSWHLERNVVRWGCAQMHCGGDGEVQLASSLPGRTWGSQDGAGRVGVSLFSGLWTSWGNSLGIHGYIPSMGDAITLCKALHGRLERDSRTGQKE